MRIALAACAALTLAGAARAEVVRQDDTSFQLRNVVQSKTTPQKAYAALGEIGRWWNGAHSYSGQASNLRLELKAGGCFCETLPDGGGIEHGRVVMAWPSQGTLRLDAALGPLQQEGVSAALTFEIKPKGDGVEIVQTYAVGGARPGMPKAFAAGVDAVMREALTRLGRYAETGKPE
ncbi:ATPase [Phenylobacterium sp. J367]|uniref:ATPase n=1 Tax=Phenylobacterium sp. J367 TaxID=2898435 RepID=UPI002151ED84|nr:ATPase [Phenylobacterium sp. J367]MCR5878210.1 ATPase [Phenylobacterium sp. J367]